jgi:conjugative transposon TraM protein
MKQNAVRTKKQKLLLLIPLFLIPIGIITYLIMSLSGKKDDKQTKPVIQNGFNKKLPEPNLNKREKNKLEIYLDAENDSLKRKEQEANDPNIKRFYDPGPDDSKTLIAPPSTNPEISKSLSPGKALDPNEKKVRDKLQKLYEAMNSSSLPGSANNLPATPGGFADNSSSKIQKLLETFHKTDTSTDPQTAQLNSMLDKVLDIQHPERIANREKQKNKSYRNDALAVTTKPFDNNDIQDQYTFPDASNSEPQNGFYSFTSESDTGVHESDNTAIRAVVHENQIVENNSTVKLRLLQDIYIKGLRIPHGSFVYGTCHFTDQRVRVELTSTTYNNQVFPIALAVFDGMDGLEGISMKGMASQDIAREGVSQGLRGLALSSLDPSIVAQAASASIETAKNLLSRKIKTIRVTLKAGHLILLKGPDKTH